MFRHLLPQQLHLRMFLYMALAFTVTIYIFSYILTRQLTNNAVTEIDRLTLQRIAQVKDNTDYTLRKLKLYSVRIFRDQNVNNWMTSSEVDYWVFKPMELSLTDYLGIEPFIQSVYVINPGINRIYASDKGFTHLTDEENKEILEQVRSEKSHNLNLQNYEVQGKSYLLLVVRDVIDRGENNSKLAVLLDKEKLQQYILQMNKQIANDVFILNEEGELMLGNISDEMLKQVRTFRLDGNLGKTHFSVDGKEWSLRYQTLSISGWKIFHLTSLETLNQSVSITRWTILLCFSLLVLIIWALLYWYSRTNIRPIGTMLQAIQARIGQPYVPSNTVETTVSITTGIESLINKVEQMNRSIKDSKSLIKEERLRQWILNGPLSEGYRKEWLQEIPVLAAVSIRLAVLRIRFYAAFCDKYDFPSRKLMKYAMSNIANEVMRQYSLTGEAVDIGIDHIVLIFPDTKEEKIDAMLQEIKSNIDQWLHIGVVAAVSDPKASDEALLQSYELVVEASMLNFIDGHDCVYSESDLKQFENRLNYLDEDVIKELVASVRIGNLLAVKGYLDQLAGDMKGMTYSECKMQLVHLIYELMKSFNKLNTVKGMEGIEHTLNQFHYLHEAFHWIETFLHQIVDDLKQRSTNNRKEEIVTEAVHYIRKNLHNPILSVDSIADHTSVSVSYLRAVFREWMDCPISDFITNQRLDRVKELLLNTDLTVAEVAEQAGFQTKSHFFTTFKKVFGTTPIQFRQQQKIK
ncbi:AraC-type DNA-binding protein [Paenibacillus sp. UNCCL117]|uniref:AraC family transcriptional regulator n=1 Tax=unclassified Paenibacillus TaxID=185978 RepID=UPI00089055D8|nr:MULTISPECIES: AraC family transcriptional regulator [unclassified Paenibacillus]SDC44909.1 AraC-type DNA-binding protein [Paenibacillus sp. cl123]SFW12638.1 AraC-type DNA-binding protein [Paenibacillus sp. UNCCL117]